MEFRIEQDSNDPLRFYTVPADEVEHGVNFMRRLKAAMEAQVAPSEAMSVVKRAVAQEAEEEFRQMQAHRCYEIARRAR